MARRSPDSNRPVCPSSTPATRKGISLTSLAQQMLQDMQLAGLGERTHESYFRAVRKFAQWLHQSPDQASKNDLRRYLLFIKNDKQWEANSLKIAHSRLKFFYCHTCPPEWPTLRQLRVPKQFRLPTVLTTASCPNIGLPGELAEGHPWLSFRQASTPRSPGFGFHA